MAVGRSEEAAAEASCWTDAEWFIDNSIQEEKPPLVPESTGHTAALFCVEALGVAPPPETGWVPRDKETSRSGESKDKDVWYRNVKTSDWIYHHNESMYYHLPTSSLWERRPVECTLPTVESHTYCRVDSNVLQALSRFAMSLDVGLLPMAFKAWVRFMRKKKDKHFGMPAPQASPAAKKAEISDLPPETQVADSTFAGASAPPGPDADETEGSSPGKAKTLAPAIVMDATRSLNMLKASRSSQWLEPEIPDVLLEPRADRRSLDNEAMPPVPEDPPVEPSRPADPGPKKEFGNPADSQESSAEDQPLKDGGRKGGLFCLRCFRSGRSKARRKGDAPTETTPALEPTNVQSPANAAATVAAGGAAAAADCGAATAPAAQSPTKAPPEPVAQTASSPEKEDQSKNTLIVDSVERHVRRLDSFLDLVMRNPQRLVDHIEKRRLGKTTSLGAFVA